MHVPSDPGLIIVGLLLIALALIIAVCVGDARDQERDQ